MSLAVMTVVAAATWFDVRFRKIPNWLTGFTMLSGLVFHTFRSGLPGFQQSAAGLFLGLLLLSIPFVMNGMGAGDLKLLAAVGSCTGPAALVHVFLAAAIAGGLLSLAAAYKHRAVLSSLRSAKERLVSIVLTRKLVAETEAPGPRIYVPYAVSIGVGYAWTFLQGGIPL